MCGGLNPLIEGNAKKIQLYLHIICSKMVKDMDNAWEETYVCSLSGNQSILQSKLPSMNKITTKRFLHKTINISYPFYKSVIL